MSSSSSFPYPWNADLYDGKHAFVSGYGLDLISLLEPEAGERILDLGCGTGVLTKELAEKGGVVIGLDRSSEMIAKAKASFPDLEFVRGDGHDFHFSQTFDAVFSNAALHWMTDPSRVIACVWDALKGGGRFVAEFGGQGNVQTLLECIAMVLREDGDARADVLVNYFPTVGEYATLLEAQGFRVTHAFHFDRPTPLADGELGLRSWVRMFRGFILEGSRGASRTEKEQNELLARIEDRARPRLYREGTWYADYKRLRVRAVKPK